MDTEWHFPVLIAASLALYLGLLRLILGGTRFRLRLRTVLLVSLLVVVGGMMFGKYGATALSLPWWIYYPVPALVTIVLAPVVFRMGLKKTLVYLVLSAASAPLIHLFSAFFLGWHEYMPFLRVPSLGSLLE